MAETRRRRAGTPRGGDTEPAPASGAGRGEEAAQRVERLREGVARLRIRGWSFDVPRLLMVGGGALLILGLAFIGAAWYGAAHTPYLFEQVPYLISGGLLGLGLTFAGGAFYFAYWLTRQVRDTKQQAEATQDALRRIEEALRAGLGGSGDGRAASRDRGAAANGSFVATAKGTMFHRPDCVVVAGRSDLRRVSAETKGLEPCRMCDPLAEAPQPAAP